MRGIGEAAQAEMPVILSQAMPRAPRDYDARLRGRIGSRRRLMAEPSAP